MQASPARDSTLPPIVSEPLNRVVYAKVLKGIETDWFHPRPWKRAREHSRGDGFTLIELLVVVAILAVLIAIIIPVTQSAMLTGKRMQSLQNLRSIAIGFASFQGEQDGRLPGNGANANSRWIHVISPYLGNKANWNSPVPGGTSFPVDTHAYGRAVFHSPLTPEKAYTQPYNNSTGMYGYNRRLRGGDFFSPYRVQQIKRPSSLVMVASKYYLGTGPTLETDAPYPANRAGVAANYQKGKPKDDGTGPAIYLFADGHIEVLLSWPGEDAFDPEFEP